MSYESPIEVIYKANISRIEDDVVKCVQSYGINVDKDEMLKALRYDRRQYEKGYAEGRAEAAFAASERIAHAESRIEGLIRQVMENEEIRKAFGLVTIIIGNEIRRLRNEQRHGEAADLEDALTIIVDYMPQQGEDAE